MDTPTGLDNTSTETLIILRDNLQRGIASVFSMTDEELYTPKDEKSIPPFAGAQLSSMLLSTVDRELVTRGLESVVK